MLIESLTRIRENEARLQEILCVLGKYGLADWVGASDTKWLRRWTVTANGQRLNELGHEERIRLAILELGTTFVKLGQMLSTRPELVGESLAAELSKLQAGTPADSIEVVRRTIQTELGKPPEDLFEEFCPEALASASIAQVHRARLRNGQPVVVKIQHDGIETKIQRDLDLMRGLAELAEKHVPALRNYRPVSTVREFRRTLLRELDLRAERHNLEEFARHFAGDSQVHFPTVYAEYCGRRVLTMELLEGIPGCDAKRLAKEVNLSGFARRAAVMYLDMIFRDGFYHADPHPGNYIILPGDVVGVLDCGMVGRLDESLRDEIEGALWAVIERDGEELVERVIHVGAPPTDLDREALRADVNEFVADYASRPLNELDLSAALGDMVGIIARYHIVLPANVSLLLRTLIVLEGSARQLDPAFSLMDVIADYSRRSGSRRILPRRAWRDARRMARGYTRLFQNFPGDAADVLNRFRAGTLEFRHDHRRLQASVHRLAEALIAGALLLGSALLLSQGERYASNHVGLLFGLLFLGCGAWLTIRLLLAISAAQKKDNGE